MTFTYRRAEPRDGTACAKIIQAWGAETPWMVPLDDLAPMAAFWSDLITEASAWVAVQDAQVVGFSLREDNTISGLYVLGAARNRGVGKRLLDLAKAGQDKITVWAYEANTEARRFYRREGLVEVYYEVEPSSTLMNIEHRWIRSPTFRP